MRHLLLAFAFASLAAAAPSAAANPEDRAINALYVELAKARADADVAGMAAAFADGALLVDQRPGPPVSGAELPAVLKPMTERLRTEKVTIDTAYRIERRSVIGDVAMDAGFMRQTMTRADGKSGNRYARFLVTMQRDGSGKWRIVGDASMPSDQAAFDAVKRTDGLHFDS